MLHVADDIVNRKGRQCRKKKSSIVRTSLDHLEAYELESLLLEPAAKAKKKNKHQHEKPLPEYSCIHARQKKSMAYLLMMSPTRPRWTASGLIMMKVCSRAAMLTDIARLC
jgi:hypothetical protein